MAQNMGGLIKMANMLGFQQQMKLMEESDRDCMELLRPAIFVFSSQKKRVEEKKIVEKHDRKKGVQEKKMKKEEGLT